MGRTCHRLSKPRHHVENHSVPNRVYGFTHPSFLKQKQEILNMNEDEPVLGYILFKMGSSVDLGEFICSFDRVDECVYYAYLFGLSKWFVIESDTLLTVVTHKDDIRTQHEASKQTRQGTKSPKI